MIPCYICNTDIGGGWYIGFPPAPDSQKMGLCHTHDLPEYRRKVQKAWQKLIYQSIADDRHNLASRLGDKAQLLSIYFTGGGSVSLPCTSVSLIEEKTLKALTPGGENIFFPLIQIRNYALTPLELQPRQAYEKHSGEPEALAPNNMLTNEKKDGN